MDTKIKEKFISHWEKYFKGAELPITFYYTNEVQGAEAVKPSSKHRCIFADLCKVRTGKSLYFDAESIGCFGGKRYLGFSTEVMENFEYFLSCGIPGKLEGERYKKTPELVKETMCEPNGVFAPFAAGCGSIVQYPYLEKDSDHPRGILGMFDVSARPFIPENILSFSVPMNRLVEMIGNMEESFLITQSWAKINKRIKKPKP